MDPINNGDNSKKEEREKGVCLNQATNNGTESTVWYRISQFRAELKILVTITIIG